MNHTLYLGLVLPTTKFTKCETTGISSRVLRPGICLATVRTVGRKFPNKFKNPNASTNIPTNPQRRSMRAMPRKKKKVPRSRSLLQSSRAVVRKNENYKTMTNLPCEECERAFDADDKDQADDEEGVSDGDQRGVQHQHDTEENEPQTQTDQTDAYFLVVFEDHLGLQ